MASRFAIERTCFTCSGKSSKKTDTARKQACAGCWQTPARPMPIQIIVQPIRAVEVNGLTGHCIAYNDACYGNYQARFQLPDNRVLLFSVIAQHGTTILAVMETQLFQKALHAARKMD